MSGEFPENSCEINFVLSEKFRGDGVGLGVRGLGTDLGEGEMLRERSEMGGSNTK